MRYLWQDIEKITTLLRNGLPKVLFLDFDGTLAPIAKSPHLANISKKTQKLLQDLYQKPKIYLAIISGRRLGDLKNKVGVPNITYASKHGFKGKIQDKKFLYPVKKKQLNAIFKIKDELQNLADQFKGAFLEDKKIMLAFHFRAVEKDQVRQLKKSLEKILRKHQDNGLIATTSGKKVLEILPRVSWNKGYFAEMLIGKIAGQTKKDPVGIVVGDDLTDEHMFQKLNKEITITVGIKQKSKAKYYLKDPEDVLKFLTWLKFLL
ncbi:trehalose-phosphatase [Candidatus Daviesbacteria bacterium]|nr:trehalose-phosphatase [Candidatus Daviesbacteria bacterium]